MHLCDLRSFGRGIFGLLDQWFGKEVEGIALIIAIFVIACVQLYKSRFRNEKAYLYLARKYPRLLRENETSEGTEKRMKPIYEVLYMLLKYFIWILIVAFTLFR
jgi:hypothetical protein